MHKSVEFKLFTCHAEYDGSLEISVEPAAGFELDWDGAHVNGDEDRIRSCMVQGARDAFKALNSKDTYRITVLRIVDRTGSSLPATFQRCMERALTDLIG